MYKDKERQKEANRLAAKRYRSKRKGMTASQPNVIPDRNVSVIPTCKAPYGERCTCFKCQLNEGDLEEARRRNLKPEVPKQSYNPMMVGYVPPKVVK